jgi:hypothetical protein
VLTASTVFARALHLDDRMPTIIDGGRPADTRLACWTARLVLVPIDGARLGVKAGALAGLPVIIEACGSQEIHPRVIPTLDAEVGVQEAGLDDRGAGQQAPWLQRGVALGGRRAVGCRAGSGVDGRDQVRPIVLTRFRAMHLIPDPRRGVLAGLVGFRGIGGADEPCCWGDIIGLAPLERAAVPPIILPPDPAQDGDGGHCAQPGRGVWVINRRQ